MSLLVAFFVGFPGPIAARAETAIHFTLDRKIDGPAAPFFLAIDKGYFKDEGLDVTIDAATGGPLEAMNRVAAGSDDMGVADINMLIKARDAANTSIKALFIVFDKPPYAIIARKSRGIETPRSLEARSSSRRPPIRPSRNGRSSPGSTASIRRKLRSKTSACRCASRCWHPGKWTPSPAARSPPIST